jgi:hypothetical protein
MRLLAAALLAIAAFAACGRRADVFPHSMTGYELYSFRVDTDWNYTLITGTSREKTFTELSSPDGSIAPGAIKVTTRAAQKMASVMSLHLPRGEQVVWQSRRPAGLSFPPAADRDIIRKSAEEHGLALVISD